MSKRIAILGSTGSIGCSALQVIEHLGPPYRVVGLTAHRQMDKLVEQVRKSGAAAVGISGPEAPSELRGLGCEIYHGEAGLTELVRRPDVDVVLSAIVGAAGLPASLAAVQAGKTLALANKESLVVAGSLLIPEAKKRRVRILPVDSEHSAIFQAYHCGRAHEVKRVILTASGGPFRKASKKDMDKAKLADALKHPTWQMGTKVTVDSATMFNKGLELIEACWLFDLPPEKVEIVVHPESVVHSMVEYVDGSIIAQLSPPDMRTPIQYALTYPERAGGIAPKLDLAKAFSLNFEPPDFERFPALRIAYDVARRGGTLGAVMNAANEVAVDAFAADRIPFGRISDVVGLTIERHSVQTAPTLADLFEADGWARRVAQEMIGSG